MTKISYFKGNIKNTKPTKTLYFDEYLEAIQEGDFKREVLNYRANPTPENKANILPYVTTSGEFRLKRSDKNLIKHSGFIALDIDVKSNKSRIREYKDKLIDPNVYAQHLSVGGEGLVAYIKVPPEDHEKAFREIQKHFRKRYGLILDSLPDLSRPRYVSYDPDIIYNKNSPVWGISPNASRSLKIESRISSYDIDIQGLTQAKAYEKLRDEWFEKQYDFHSGRNISITKFCGGLASRGINKGLAKKWLIKDYEEEDFDSNEISRIVNSIFSKNQQEDKEKKDKAGFCLKKASEVMQEYVSPLEWHLKQLIAKGEITFLFGDSNTGKSVIAVQLADAWSKGLPHVLGISNDLPPQKVLYMDFELTTRQFQTRYSEEFTKVGKRVQVGLIRHSFHDNFLRAVPASKQASMPERQEAIAEVLESSTPDILIIDNISFMVMNDEKKEDAKSFMAYIDDLTKSKGMTVLILAHTPKTYGNEWGILELKSMAGSAMLNNYADCSIGLGKSKLDGNVRYLKHLKGRNDVILYDENSIIECEIVKEDAFTQFQYLRLGNELNHVKPDKQKRDNLEAVINEYMDVNPDWGAKKIFKKVEEDFSTSLSTVKRIYNKLKSEL